MFTRHAQAPAYLIGSSGVPNYGDEFILALWLRFLALTQPSRPVWIDVLDPGISAVLMSAIHPQVTATNTLWRIAAQCAAFDPERQVAEAENLVRRLGTPRADAGLDLLRHVGSIHLVGGGYLNSVWPTNSLLAPLASQAAEEAASPIWATGQGLAPVDQEVAKRLATAFSRFTSAESRQPDLDDLLVSAGVRDGVDDAFLGFHPHLIDLWRDRRRAEPPRFMLLLQSDFGAPEGRAEIFALALDELRAAGWRGERIGLVEAIPPDDAWPRSHLETAGVDYAFYSFLDLWQHGLPIRPGQYWVSTRFHFHLLAGGRGLPGTAISLSDSYYLPKHSSLTALGSGWRVVNSSGDLLTAAAPAQTAGFASRARELGQRKWALAESIYRPQRLRRS